MDVEVMKRVAIVIAQAARLNAEVALMQAGNQERESRGHSLAYGEDQFQQVIDKYSVLEHGNAAHFLAG